MTFILDAQLFDRLYPLLHRSVWLPFFSGITHLGDPSLVLALATFGFLESGIAWAWGVRRRGKNPEGQVSRERITPLLAWAAIPLAAFVTGWLKDWVKRPRPSLLDLSGGFPASEMARSFPSGHAALSFALATVLSIRWPRGRVIWFALAALVALSRVALGVHWPSDVLVGAGIGWGLASVLGGVERKLRRC
jgi:membrane-associated phospholipid phosphatase